MIVLDTNVISELFRTRPDSRVVTWMEEVSGEVAITAITVAELLAGLRRMPESERRSTLTSTIHTALEPYLQTQAVLAFDASAASHYAEVLFMREHAGRPISTADAQIASICRAQGAICATRNIRDFVHTGTELVNPWDA